MFKNNVTVQLPTFITEKAWSKSRKICLFHPIGNGITNWLKMNAKKLSTAIRNMPLPTAKGDAKSKIA